MSIVREILAVSSAWPLSSTSTSSSKSRSTLAASGPVTEIWLPCTRILDFGEGPLDDAQVLVARSEQSRHQVRIRYEGGRREGLLGRGIKGHPGGHSIRRPPRTCRCRCGTDI